MLLQHCHQFLGSLLGELLVTGDQVRSVTGTHLGTLMWDADFLTPWSTFTSYSFSKKKAGEPLCHLGLRFENRNEDNNSRQHVKNHKFKADIKGVGYGAGRYDTDTEILIQVYS